MDRARPSDSPRPTAGRDSFHVAGRLADIELEPDAAGHSTSLLFAVEEAADDCCECCGDAFTDSSPSSPSSVDPSICEWCYVNGYDDDCDQGE